MKKRLVLAVTTIFAEIFMWLLSMPLDITFQFFGTSTIRIHKLLRYALDACGSSLVFRCRSFVVRGLRKAVSQYFLSD